MNIQAGTFVLDGLITANGDQVSSCQAGSGSGGTVNIIASSISGAGTITANGGGGKSAAAAVESLYITAAQYLRARQRPMAVMAVTRMAKTALSISIKTEVVLMQETA